MDGERPSDSKVLKKHTVLALRVLKLYHGRRTSGCSHGIRVSLMLKSRSKAGSVVRELNTVHAEKAGQMSKQDAGREVRT